MIILVIIIIHSQHDCPSQMNSNVMLCVTKVTRYHSLICKCLKPPIFIHLWSRDSNAGFRKILHWCHAFLYALYFLLWGWKITLGLLLLLSSSHWCGTAGWFYDVWIIINSLWPSDAIYRSGSSLSQAMACCPMAPSHYLNQCWLFISDVMCHWFESNFGLSAQATILYNELINYTYKITAPSLPGANELSSSRAEENGHVR